VAGLVPIPAEHDGTNTPEYPGSAMLTRGTDHPVGGVAAGMRTRIVVAVGLVVTGPTAGTVLAVRN
jgi:hypothetical protein